MVRAGAPPAPRVRLLDLIEERAKSNYERTVLKPNLRVFIIKNLITLAHGGGGGDGVK